MPDKPILTREALLNGEVERFAPANYAGLTRMSDEERAELVQHTLSAVSDDTELWIFGYGSLIWNPAFEFAEQRKCWISGFEKKFCFWTMLSRGTAENPGLMMGLIEGGQCNGMAFRIEREKAVTELDILFRREMSFYVYKPTWLDARCVDTGVVFKTLTFVVDTSNERYDNNLSRAEIVRTIATAEGPLGRNCDYLFQLSEKLQELGYVEDELEELVRDVRAYQGG